MYVILFHENQDFSNKKWCSLSENGSHGLCEAMEPSAS